MTDLTATQARPLRLPRIHLPSLRGQWTWERLLQAAFFWFVAAGAISLIEPSPYDLMFLIVTPMWLISKPRVHKSLAAILFLWIVYLFAGFLTLTPYFNEPDPVKYQFQTLYLISTVVLFSIFFSQNAEERLERGLRGFAAGAIFSAALGLLAYFNVAGLGATMVTEFEGRLNGTFKDPNVLGSYLILAACFLAQSLLLQRARRPLLTFAGLLTVLMAIFLSFSRGSWAATLVALSLVFVWAFLTCGSPKLRRRMTGLILAGVFAASAGIVTILTNDRVEALLADRFTVTKDYDEGPNGRFGNQIRSIPMLLERPMGFGPLRYRLTFNLDPHNSYVNSFASFGWLGGFSWFIIVGWTMFVGFRLMSVNSPVRRYAQVFWPALFVLLLQGFQIDIDHWRQVFLCFGAIWGMEAARVRWMTDQARQKAFGDAVGRSASAA